MSRFHKLLFCLWVGMILAYPSWAYAPYHKLKKIAGTITAYASVEWLTDDTPFISASGDYVHDGMVANNCLDFGTRVEIEGVVYTVGDRFHSRFDDRCDKFDIWKDSYESAKAYGTQYHEVTILE